MVNYGIFLTKFLDSDTSSLMSRELRVALIEQFGGEEAFLEDYDHVAYHGIEGISESFYSTSISIGEFYEKNKEQIKLALKEFAANSNLDSAVALVDSQSNLRDKHDTNLDDIADAIYGSGNTSDGFTYQNEVVIAWIVDTCGAELCRDYQNFMSQNVNDM